MPTHTNHGGLFEVYILNEAISAPQWLQLHKAIVGHLGTFGGSYDVLFRCTDNIVRFFVRSDRDLSTLSNAIDGMLLRPCGDAVQNPAIAPTKERFVQFVGGGNILDLKEKYHIQKAKNLEYARFTIKAFRHDKAIMTKP